MSHLSAAAERNGCVLLACLARAMSRSEIGDCQKGLLKAVVPPAQCGARPRDRIGRPEPRKRWSYDACHREKGLEEKLGED